jgi:hypothetical protein
MRFVKYAVETWKCELGNKRRSVNYELFLKNSKKRSKSYKLRKLRQRKLRQLHPLRQLNRKPRNHDNLARTSPHSLEPAKSAQPRFPSGHALFKHLPDCKPFRCTKCDSTFPSNTIFHKHVRRCRRPKKTEDINKSVKKQENQEELPGEVAHKEN